MRVLVLGAGGTGGYFGGRLAQSGADVTFLVRTPRAEQLRRDGLRIRSLLGNVDVDVGVVTADDLAARVADAPFDLVLLSCKAYDLDSAMDAIAPAVTGGAAVLPILNGLRHYAALDARFGAANVIGGLCFISAMKGEHGEVLHLGKPASITFGERAASGVDRDSVRTRDVAVLCATADIDHERSDAIEQAQWNKFTFLATLAASTCLMRAPVGRIVAADGGEAFIAALHDQCLAVATASGHPIPPDARDFARTTLTQADSQLTASMLRDLQAGQRVEAAHIVGDLHDRAVAAGIEAPELTAAWVHLQAYEAGRGAS